MKKIHKPNKLHSIKREFIKQIFVCGVLINMCEVSNNLLTNQ